MGMKILKADYSVFSSDILFYNTCSCGAITIETKSGTYSCKLSNFKTLFPNVDLRQCKKAKAEQEWSICDHCVNGYGLDLCSCGSGAAVGKCDCGSKQPMQTYGDLERTSDSFSVADFYSLFA